MSRGTSIICAVVSSLLLLSVVHASALRIKDHYSPLNRKRAKRKRTDYILLHTTEGPTKGSLNKVHRYGETHYLVATDGQVYRIVDKKRIALHAGRSMWRGQKNLDSSSIGIEVVGYHNRDITAAQYAALRELLRQLQKIYGIPDERVLTHSMVAYGAPNRWHKRSHRGRKRCGMLFAKRSVRTKLGLDKQPLFDPDVKAGRLINADPYLAKVLYGSAQEQLKAASVFEGDDALVISAKRSAWDIARDKYKSPETLYIFPDGKKFHGNEITKWKSMPAGTRVVLSATQSENAPEGMRVIGHDGATAEEVAGEEAYAKTTIYFMPDGRVRQGHELKKNKSTKLPKKTRILVGYVHGGYVTAKRPVFKICGAQWNSASTVYRFTDGQITTGNTLQESAIPPRSMVFFPQ